MDWILRIPLHYALSQCWRISGNATEARRHALALLELAAQPKERTYLGLAHVALAECEILEQQPKKAFDRVEQASAAIDQANIPLADSRISLTAARVCEQEGRPEVAARYRKKGLEVLNKLANSLDETDRLRHSLLESSVFKELSS